MIADIRKQFNLDFRPETYQALLEQVAAEYNFRPNFRIAETPIFIPRGLKQQLLEACEEITDVIVRPDFRELSQGAIATGLVLAAYHQHRISEVAVAGYQLTNPRNVPGLEERFLKSAAA